MNFSYVIFFDFNWNKRKFENKNTLLFSSLKIYIIKQTWFYNYDKKQFNGK